MTAQGEALDFRGVFVVMDFDGTITTRDCLRSVLRHHVSAWAGLSRAVGEGRLSEVCALEEAIRQLGPSREPLIAEFVECARLRRGFAGFLRRVQSYGGRTAVVTAAFSEAIEAVWRSERLDPVVLVAAELRDKRSGGFELVPNRLLGDCPSCGGGRCKGGVIRALRKPGDVVVFGDGGRDLCMAREADLVFARDRLRTLRGQVRISTLRFDDFNGAVEVIARRLEENRTPSRAGDSSG